MPTTHVFPNNKITLRLRLKYLAIIGSMFFILAASLNTITLIPASSKTFNFDLSLLLQRLSENYNKTPLESFTNNEIEEKEVFVLGTSAIFIFYNIKFLIKDLISHEFYISPSSEKFTPPPKSL